MPSWIVPVLVELLPKLPEIIKGIKDVLESHPTEKMTEEELSAHQAKVEMINKLHQALV